MELSQVCTCQPGPQEPGVDGTRASCLVGQTDGNITNNAIVWMPEWSSFSVESAKELNSWTATLALREPGSPETRLNYVSAQPGWSSTFASVGLGLKQAYN